MRPVSYTWDNAMVEGRRRLALLEHSLDPSTFRRLEGIGVAPGWRCLDVGAGRFLRSLDLANFDVREENVVDADLPPAMFDLVHTRWTLMHIPECERVLQKLVDCLAPGGTLFVEKPDAISVRTLDRSGFRSLCLRVFEIVQSRGSHPDWSRDLPFKMTSLGLGNVPLRARPRTSAAPRSSPSSGESVGDACAMRSLKRERTSRNGIANWRSSTIPRDCS